MFVYRNRNTGDEVEYGGRSTRLDNLGNWDLVASPAALTVQSAEKPKQSASKDDWVAFIASTTDLSEAEAADLTKAELVALADDE